MSTKVLITGGLGYTGSHFVTHLAQDKRYNIVLLDSLKNSSLTKVADIEDILDSKLTYYQVDLRESNSVHKLIEKIQPDIVVHCAHARSFGEAHEDAFLYYQHNVIGTINLLNAMYKNDIRKFISLSTVKVYDTFLTVPPFSETDMCKPINAFATTKHTIEQMLDNVARLHNFHAITLRTTNIIGAHRSGLLGRSLQLLQGDPANFLYNVALGRFPTFTIHGNDYDSPDGTVQEDFVHVADVADAIKHATDRVVSGGSNMAGHEIYNIGSGIPTTRLEFVAHGENAIDKNIPYEVKSHAKKNETNRTIIIDKAKKYLHRTPKRSLYDALSDGWKYVKKTIQ